MKDGQNHYEVIADGRTVWVNGPDGGCVGRFSRFGIDAHFDTRTQVEDGKACLACTNEMPTMAEWERFVSVMADHYGVRLTEKHRPAFLGRPEPEQVPLRSLAVWG